MAAATPSRSDDTGKAASTPARRPMQKVGGFFEADNLCLSQDMYSLVANPKSATSCVDSSSASDQSSTPSLGDLSTPSSLAMTRSPLRDSNTRLLDSSRTGCPTNLLQCPRSGQRLRDRSQLPQPASASLDDTTLLSVTATQRWLSIMHLGICQSAERPCLESTKIFCYSKADTAI